MEWMFFLLLILIIGVAIFLKFGSFLKKSPNTRQITNDIDPLSIDIHDIDNMLDGSEFEIYLYRLFHALGYKEVYKTVGSRDFGADLVFTDRSGVRNVVQAKRYKIDNLVGISGVQEVYSSMRFYKAKKSILIATSTYTNSCETLAGINHVKLLDRTDLISIIAAFKQGDLEKAKNIIEAEPRVILDSWTDYTDSSREMKKDKRAEKLIRGI
ncbi:restriction endonuclease [Brevibacillus laterosporus]|uniref:restriction endonuclease n=1 Tax=Brevibacillus laterosporus TaxID=1465 RepID=UPI0009F4D03C|nr:restriction endonuclease [Brevibacillus laterosporus]